MGVLFGLASLAGLSLFLARFSGRSPSLMPLVAVALCSLWFTLWGCLGLLLPAGVAWYLLCAAALFWVVFKQRKRVLAMLTPGFLLFVLGGVFFIAVFSATRPMLTSWDEFTFWGTAAKVTVDTNQLYTVADSNLIARSYPPGLIVFNYAMQFFGGFGEYKFMAALCVLYLAAFAAGAALLDKRRPVAVLVLAALVVLPLFFETAPAVGDISKAYRTCYADPSLAALFGGALALYFGSEEKDEWTFWMLAAVLAALTNVKDIGLALAFLVVLVVVVDILVCERKNVFFTGLAGWKALLCGAGVMAGLIVAAYLGWAMHLRFAPMPVDRFDVGSGGETLSAFGMLVAGGLALFGVGRTEQFSKVLGEMVYALNDANRPGGAHRQWAARVCYNFGAAGLLLAAGRH